MTNDPQAVLYVVDSLGLSGRTKGFIDLALHLDNARYRPMFCSFDDEGSELVEQLHERKIPVEVLPLPPGLHARGVWQLAQLLRRHDIKVVHPVNPRPLLYAGLAAQLCGIRSTVGSLSAFACQIPDRAYEFLPQELANRGRRQALRNQLAAQLMRYIIAVSNELGERFCRFTAEAAGPMATLSYRALRRRMHAIGYGIDLRPYQAVQHEEIAVLRAQLGATRDTVLVGSVGRLVEQKDYITQLRAFAIAASTEPQLRMVLAGEGPLRASISRHAVELGIADRIVLLGHWTRVPALLRSLDVFVLASKFEPYGVALLEAKCAGCAIVATEVNEVSRIVKDGVTGLVVPAQTPELMAHAFQRLARDAGLRRTLAENAYTQAQEMHSIDSAARAYQKLYDTLS